jgi:hypothetical protein
MMALKKQEFSVNGFKQIIFHLLHYALIGSPIEYEMKVNEVIVIRRTKDLLMFFLVEFSFIETLSSMEIVLYTEDGAVQDSYIYTFSEAIEKIH